MVRIKKLNVQNRFNCYFIENVVIASLSIWNTFSFYVLYTQIKLVLSLLLFIFYHMEPSIYLQVKAIV